MAFSIMGVEGYHGTLSVHFLGFPMNASTNIYIVERTNGIASMAFRLPVLLHLLFSLGSYYVGVLSYNAYMVQAAA